MEIMNGEMLSQDEIDALLRGETSSTFSDENEVRIDVSSYLDDIQQDALGEIGNISFGSSATALSTLLNQKVEITTPSVSIIDKSNLENEFPHPYVAIQVEYTSGFTGANILVVKQSDASIIADLMLGGDGTTPSANMDDLHISAVQEAMNQMMGSAATSMSSVFNKKIDISPPTIELLHVSKGEGTDTIPDENLLVKISFNLKIGNLIDSDIMQVLPIQFAKEMVSELFSTNGQTEAAASDDVIVHDIDAIDLEPKSTPSIDVTHHHGTHQHIDVQMEEQPVGQKKPAYDHHQIQSASFSEFQDPAGTVETKNLDILLDIPLNVTVELGRSQKTVQEILEFSKGSIIELDKLAGEPVDILVNRRLIAKGEVVVIDENFGVRVTDIVSQSDRLKKLK